MAEPRKETVRIALPPRPEVSPESATVKRDTARIVLPSRTPVSAAPVRRLPPTIQPPSSPEDSASVSPPTSLPRPPMPPMRASDVAASPLLTPLPKPAGPGSTPALPGNGKVDNRDSGAAVHPGPKKETARITILPKPAPTVNMKKTQPLITRPAATAQTPRVIVATSKPGDVFDSIPRSFCWGLLGISALIFLIQLWNYFSF